MITPVNNITLLRPIVISSKDCIKLLTNRFNRSQMILYIDSIRCAEINKNDEVIFKSA